MQLIHCTGKLQQEMGLKKADLCEVAPKFYYLGSWHADLLYIDRRKCVLSLLKHQAQIILTKISANTYFAECWCCSRIIV